MKLLTYWQNDALRLGVVTDAGVVDVAAAANGTEVPTTIEAVLAGGSDALSALSSVASGAGAAHILQESSLTLGPCVPNPGKILCVGLNYRRHAEETNAAIPTSPVLFSKFNNTLAGDRKRSRCRPRSRLSTTGKSSSGW